MEFGDSHGAEIIQNGCIGCLAHLGVLCDLIGRLEPNFKLQTDSVCNWSLERLGELTQGMCLDEYTYLDLLLKVRSWVDRSLQKKVHFVLVTVRSLGKGRWLYLILGSVSYRLTRAHLYGVIGKLSHLHGRISRSGFRMSLLFRSLPCWYSPMVGKRGRNIRTLFCLQRDGPMGYEPERFLHHEWLPMRWLRK